MAVSMAYGDSTTYFRTRSEADQMKQAAAFSAQMGNSTYPFVINNPYQNALRIHQPKEPSTTSRIIADRGMGGAESRPRSRRYAKTPTTASSPPPQS